MRRKLEKRLADIRGLLGRLDAFMLSVNGVRRYEYATMTLFILPSLAGRSGLSAQPVHLELFLRTVPRPSTSAIRKLDLPPVQCFSPPPTHITSRLLTTDDTHASGDTADVDLLLDSADKPDGPFHAAS